MTTDDSLIQIFYTIDQDKSGVIDVEELHTYLRLNKFDEFFTSRFLEIFDRNRDGKIPFEEYRKALYKIPHTQKCYATWHDVLHKVDKDQNGYITMVELYEMLHESGDSEKIDMKDLQSFIREYDHDGDGKLNYHEFLHYILDSSNTKT